MSKQVVVIGLGRFGSAVARTLYELGNEVMAIDTDRRRVEQITDEVTYAVQADGADREAMRDDGVADFDAAIVAISGDLAPSILTTLTLRELGVRYIIAKAGNDQHARILERIGGDRVVFPERETGVRLAHTFGIPAVIDHMDLTPGFFVAKVGLPDRFVGKTTAEMDLHGQYGLTFLAVVHGAEVVLHPLRDERMRKGDILLVAGRAKDLGRLQA